MFSEVSKLSAPSGFEKIIYFFKLFHQIFVTIFLIFSLLILFVVIFLLRKIKLAVDVICQIGNLIQSISQNITTNLFLQNLNFSKQKFEDIEKIVENIDKITKETYEIIDELDKALDAKTEIPSKSMGGISIIGREYVIPTESAGAIPKRYPTKNTYAISKHRLPLAEMRKKMDDMVNQTESVQSIIDAEKTSLFLGQSEMEAIGKQQAKMEKQQDKMEKSTSQGLKEKQEDSKSEEVCDKVAAASKLGGMKKMAKTRGAFAFFKKEKKMQQVEMVEVGQPKTETGDDDQTKTKSDDDNQTDGGLDDKTDDDGMEEVNLSDNETEKPKLMDDRSVKPENTFLFRMIGNRRFKNLFTNCCRCNNKCNCGINLENLL